VAGAEEKKDDKDRSQTNIKMFVWLGLARKCCGV
jgi:hypothetical protein